MLKFSELSLRRGPRLLFDRATCAVHPGQKVGITGINGTGKSSLLALIRGDLAPDAGSFHKPSAWVIAHVAQETPAVDTPAVDYVMDGDGELRTLERALKDAETRNDGIALGELHTRFEAIGGYSARARAARLMHGLGFTAQQEALTVRTFSGGWRMRLNLARALMCRSDLLLLDEPTNHLDLDAVMWLEAWLSSYPGTLMLISHDREFLDNVVHHIAHIEAGRLELFAGNYSDFELRRAERLAQEQAAFERQQREVAHIRSFVERFRAKATKARQAQSRLKALARMELLAPAHVGSPFQFDFRPPPKLPHPLLQLEKAAVGYGDDPLLKDMAMTLAPGDRIGLLGPNGAGKSTFIKLLAGAVAPLHGKRIGAPDLRIGYFAQHQLEQLVATESPLWHLRRLDPRTPEQELRDHLGGFGFAGDRVLEAVAPLSGGEKARLVLSLVVYQRPNLLLLDEPTNHLDLEMRHALTVALQEFEGAMVVVSHDRHLLRSVADQFWRVGEGGVCPFDGDLEDYRAMVTAPIADEASRSKGEKSAAARAARRRDDAEKRQRLQPMRKELMRLETEMERLNREKERVTAALAEPELYGETAKEELKALLVDQARVDRLLTDTEEAWLSAVEAVEGAEQGS